MKQHDNQHAQGFGNDIKDEAIWVRLLRPQEGKSQGSKGGKNTLKIQSDINNNHNRLPCVWGRLSKVISWQ